MSRRYASGWKSLTLGTLGGSLLLLASLPDALAGDPAFDCAKAQGAAEDLICQDGDLAALDQLLTEVFGEAIAVSRAMPDDGTDLKNLKATQRGWIKGRNDCWKAGDELRACIHDEYDRRIGQLTAQYGLVKAGPPMVFRCNGQAADEIVVILYPPRREDLSGSARLERGDQTAAAVPLRVASGVKFAASEGRSLWIKGKEAILEWPFGTTAKCVERGE